jgi:hypothetical protein
MLRKAEHAHFAAVRVGGIFRTITKTYFYPDKGGRVRSAEISDEHLAQIQRAHNNDPVKVWSNGSRNYWVFKGLFYSESDSLSSADVKVLILDRERKTQRRINQAKVAVSSDTVDRVFTRTPIPDDVKVFVWRRDRGRCVRCQSQTRLEYDHVIPVVMGGSNTARNIQLLCERCNREKGGHLT